jgi:hypothetical protein
MTGSPTALRLGFALVVFVTGAAAPAAPPAKVTPDYKKDVTPLVTRYCVQCHSGRRARGGVVLDKFPDEAAVRKGRLTWEKVADALRAGDMPPPNRPRPSAAELDTLNAWLAAVVLKVDCNAQRDPGRVTLRRLNRAEYNNTVHDLLGIDFRPADDFPADDVGYGFDNIGDVLSLPPLLMEKYLAAAEKIVDKAFATPAARKRIMTVPFENEEAARRVLRAFAERAYRRPVRDDDLRRLVGLVELAQKNGDSFETGVRLALQAVLVSPHFLFRIELDRRPNDPRTVRDLNDFELASRLSYFLWSSMPDDELFRHARQRTLRKSGVLEEQVRRMLQDPRSRALTDNFAGQWLQTRNLKGLTPDPARFPGFDEKLRTAMQKETELFFESVVREDRSVLDFLDSDYTFLNERLAKHYGISGVKGDDFRKVTLTGAHRAARGGVLTQATVLAVTSNPTRTSPVKRGKWILENVLGTPPPPPPPGVDELKEGKDVELKGSLRQRMEQHRADPGCATCHQRMDPLGFGFENFDAVGAWRDKDGKHAIDPSGVLPGGKSFNGSAELKAILKGRSDTFARCLAEKLLTYALGRGVERSDRCAVDEIARNLAREQYKFSALVIHMVKSDPFQKRRGQQGVKK